MTPDQERAVAAALAEGLSERQTARRVGVSPTAVHRVRERLARDSAPEETTTVTDHDEHQADDDSGEFLLTEPKAATDPAAELAALREGRAQLAEIVAMHEARAEASRTAARELEAERVNTLAAGGDAAALRPRMRNAADDLRDYEEAARIAQTRLDEADRQIATAEARQELGRMRGELTAAVQARDKVCARTGDRQRAAVLAVRDAAVGFAATAAEERAAIDRAAMLAGAVAERAAQLGEPGPEVPGPVSTALQLPEGTPDHGAPLALLRAQHQARHGDVRAVAAHLAEAFGWLPPSAEELAADRERMQARAAEMAAQQPAPVPVEPWTRPSPDSVGLDAAGNVVPEWHRPPVPHPGDVWRAPASAWPAGTWESVYGQGS